MIRRAEDRDIPQVLCLLEQVNRVHHDIRPDLFRLTTKYTEEELRRIFTDDEAPVFVYDENGQVRGYIFTVLLDHSRNHMLTPIRELYIDDLCVDASLQRDAQRLGRQRRRAGVLSKDGHATAKDEAGSDRRRFVIAQ